MTDGMIGPRIPQATNPATNSTTIATTPMPTVDDAVRQALLVAADSAVRDVTEGSANVAAASLTAPAPSKSLIGDTLSWWLWVGGTLTIAAIIATIALLGVDWSVFYMQDSLGAATRGQVQGALTGFVGACLAGLGLNRWSKAKP